MLTYSLVEVNACLTEEARLQLSHEDLQLTLGRRPSRSTGPREAIPGLRERQEIGASAAAMGSQHRAYAAVAVYVCTHDDPLVRVERFEHRLAGPHRQAIDR